MLMCDDSVQFVTVVVCSFYALENVFCLKDCSGRYEWHFAVIGDQAVFVKLSNISESSIEENVCVTANLASRHLQGAVENCHFRGSIKNKQQRGEFTVCGNSGATLPQNYSVQISKLFKEWINTLAPESLLN